MCAWLAEPLDDLALIRTRVAAVRAAVVPDWLAEVVRPQPAPVPWPGMIRAVLAVCVPLSVAFAAGKGTLGVLPATGGLHGTMVDTGGSYLNRVKRVSSAAVFGGAAGLAIGSVIHGQGWLAVLALIVVAGASGVLGALGDIGSATGMQLLVYAVLGTGPLGIGIDQLNVHGGAIALGHPFGMTGARITATLLNGLVTSESRICPQENLDPDPGLDPGRRGLVVSIQVPVLCIHVLYLIGWGNRLSTPLVWLRSLVFTKNYPQRVITFEQARAGVSEEPA